MQVVKISRTQGAAAWLALLMSGAAMGMPQSGFAQGAAGNTREAEAAESPGITGTNASPSLPAPRFDALRRLEEQLNQTLKRFSPKNDLGAGADEIRPTRRPAVANPRSDSKQQDAFDRRKNWSFMGLEEMMGLPKTEEMNDEMSTRGINDRTRRSLIEQYYESLGRNGQVQDPNLRKEEQGLPSANSSKDNDSVPPRLRETQDTLRKLFDKDGNGRIFEPIPDRDSPADIFGLGKVGTSTAITEAAHRSYMDQYREVLGVASPGADLKKLMDPTSSGSSTKPLSTSSILGTAPGSDTGFGQLGAINPVFTPKGPEDMNTRALNQWNPMYTPPKLESKPVLPQRSTFDVPRRKF